MSKQRELLIELIYKSYATLDAIVAVVEESPEADAVRDALDELVQPLTDEERAKVRKDHQKGEGDEPG